MGYVGTIHGFTPIKAESNNKVAPKSFNDDLFTPWGGEIYYENIGNDYTLMDGTGINNNTGGSGGFGGNQTVIYGNGYTGHKNSKHRHSDYSIFYKVGSKVRTHINNMSANFDDAEEMYPTSIVCFSDAKNSANSFGGGFTCRGEKGYPYPVRGISFTYYVSKSMGAISGAGTNHKLSSSSKQEFYTRQQINQIWGIWYSFEYGRYICNKLTPNGDNWNGKANCDPANGKYIFRNTGSFTKGAGDEIMEPENGANQDLDLLDRPFRIRAMINQHESPPANSIFLGFHWQHSYGNSSSSKNRMFNVSDVQVIDPASAKVFYDDPSYHGFNAKASPYNIIRPELYSIYNSISKKDPLITLHQTSTVDTDS